MKILMTNHSLISRGGSESYLETVSAELRRLGHEVVFFARECGPVAQRLREDGFAVFQHAEHLPSDIDVIHGQHADGVAVVRERLARTPLVFATHSWLINIEDPVPELGASAYLAFNDMTLRRIRAHVATHGSAEVHRLTQPVEVSFGDPARVPLPDSPRRAVAVSRGLMLASTTLRDVCAAAGVQFDWVGAPGNEALDARHEMLSSDIVFAVGRAALEAMAAARAVFVVDEAMTGGWVTPSSYPSLEADGFTGLQGQVEADSLESALAEYSPALGADARRLAVKHHAAQHHAAALVEIYAAAADKPADAWSPATVALLAKDRFVLEGRAVRAEWEAARLRRQLDDAGGERVRLIDELTRASKQLDDLRAQRRRLRRQRNRLRRALMAPQPRGWRARLARKRR